MKHLSGRWPDPLGQLPLLGHHFVAVNLSRPGLPQPAEII